MNELRIGHVIASIADLASGTAYSVPATCNALGQLGHHVELHVLDDGGATHRPDAAYELITYARTPVGNIRRIAALGASRAMARGLAAAARRLDVLHWHGLWMMPNLYPHWATRGLACRTVVSPRGMLQPAALSHSPLVKRFFWKLLQEPAVRATSLLHATGDGEARALRDVGLTNPIVVIPNGITVPACVDAAPPDAASKRLVFLGRVHPIKGIDRILRAWRAVQDDFPGWQFDIVGPDCGGHEQQLRTLASELGASRVSFLGPRFGLERDRTLATANLSILASHSENFAMSVAESLAAGVPVICSRGTPWHAVEDEGCGYWVDNSVESLAGCLRRALSKPAEELAAMGARGRTWMTRSFAWTSKARALSEAYAWLLGGSAPQTLYDGLHPADSAGPSQSTASEPWPRLGPQSFRGFR